ncbi:MAG: GNAT family N-acetyltransferase [Myxococcota bacterium]
MNVTIRIETAATVELAPLHAARIAFSLDGYDPGDCFTPPVEDLDDPSMVFWVARIAGKPVGMAALKIAAGEVKAVYVSEAARGRGVARGLMDAVEEKARELGLTRLRLETGIHHEAAMAFYPRLGWKPIPRFDPYPENDTSRFFEKAL